MGTRTFFTTEQDAKDEIARRIAVEEKMFGYKSEKYPLHPWETVEMAECLFKIEMTVHLISNLTDKEGRKKMTYAIAFYELS